MGVFDSLLLGGVGFAKHVVGIITRPYETYRALVDRANPWELPYIGALLAVYFVIASVVKTWAFRPFLLTEQFVMLGAATGLTYLLVVSLLWWVGKKLGGKGQLRGLAIGWAYTLVPTLVWFLATSILYVFLPPPRTESLAGLTFSFLFLTFSVILFFWKTILAYLTLRFSLALDLSRIMVVVVIASPILCAYSIFMYRMGIFKVPFL